MSIAPAGPRHAAGPRRPAAPGARGRVRHPAGRMGGVGRHGNGDGGSTGTVFRLMFVCTGNICRSPFAEILTRHLLVGRLGGTLASRFAISSSGVQAVVDGDMHPDSRSELEPWGLHRAAADRFTARRLRSAMVSDADLVLGATPRHRSSVVERNPEGLPKTFSMREFARLARAVDPEQLPGGDAIERAHVLVDLARRKRGLVPPVPPEEDAVPDPMGGAQEDHHRAAVLIREAVSTFVDVVAPARPAVGPVRRPSSRPRPNTVSNRPDQPSSRHAG